MKRLVDETTDELARSLLEAGIEDRPPPGNKARVIVAMGAGGALGMFSSNAFAWLGTTAGKVTALGVAVGVAGAVWVAAPPGREARSGAEAPGATLAAQRRAAAPVDQRRGPSSPAAGDSVTGNSVAGNSMAGNSPATDAPAREAPPSGAGTGPAAPSSESAQATVDMGSIEAGTSGSDRGAAGRDDAASGERQGRSSARERARKSGARRAASKVVASKPSDLRRDVPLPAAEAPLAGEARGGSSAEQADLDTEVRLVDDMHSAARRNDREALGRSLERYRATFPDGQLKREVAEFAARLEHSDISIVR